jgi:hypothetical protein
MDKNKIIAGIIVFVLFVFVVRACKSCGNANEEINSGASTSVIKEDRVAADYQKKLIELAFIEAYYDEFKLSKNIGSSEGIVGVAKDFKDYRALMKKYIKHDSVSISTVAQKLFDKITNLQTKSFPKLRKAYADECRTMLWRNNIEVEYDGNKTITFTGGFFASNANIEDTYLKLKNALELLRFKRVNFRFTEYHDFTYYNIKSLKDSE